MKYFHDFHCFSHCCISYSRFQMERHDCTTMPLVLQSAVTSKVNLLDTISYNSLQHYPSIVDPPAPSVISSSVTIHDKPNKSDDEQRDILNLDYAKQISNGTKSLLNAKLPEPVQRADAISKPASIVHSFDQTFDTSIGFNKSYDISSTKAIEMFNRAATMSFSKTKSFPSPLAPEQTAKPFPSSMHGAKHQTSTELTNSANRSPSGGLLNAYQSPSTLHTNYSLYSLDSKSTHLAYNPHEANVQVQQSQSKHGLYVNERLEHPYLHHTPYRQQY